MAHIEKLPSGKYRVAWRVDGKKQSRTFEDEWDARFFAAGPEANPYVDVLHNERARQRMQGRRGPGAPTVARFGAEVIDDPELAQNSRDMYAAALRKVTADPLGSMELDEVKAKDVDAFFRRLRANRANVKATLSKVFRAAVRHGHVTENPMARADVKIGRKKAKLRRGDPRILTADQLEALARATRNERDALAVRLGGYVGLRAGEIGGLQVEDVDAQDCRIHVRHNAQRTSAGYEVRRPKTDTSERSLKVPCSLTRELAEYAAQHARADGTIFWTRDGNPMTDQTLTHVTVRAAERAGLRRVTFHDLRHTCASLLIAARLEPKSIQTYLGHASIRMTYDVYGGLFPEADEPLAEAMEALRAAAERKALPAGDGAP
jgi:integrase